MKGVQRELESVKNALTIINADIGARSNTLLKVSSKRTASTSSKWTFKDVVDMENQTLKSQVENVFRMSLMSQVMAEFSCYFMEYSWSMGSTLAHTHFAMVAFLYGHQKNATKKDFKSGPARVHCDFKFRFVRALFVEGGKQIERDCMRENETRRSLKMSLPAERREAHRRSFARVENEPGVSSLILPV